MRRDREPRYNGADFRASKSADVAVGQRPQWLQKILSLEQTEIARGGTSYAVIDATAIYPPIDRVRKGLNGQAGRALALVYKAMERRLPTGAIPGFMQEVIEHPSPAVPPIIEIQDRDPNPNARVRAFFSVADGKCIIRAISGVERRDQRTIHDVFRVEGYRINSNGLNPASGRE